MSEDVRQTIGIIDAALAAVKARADDAATAVIKENSTAAKDVLTKIQTMIVQADTASQTMWPPSKDELSNALPQLSEQPREKRMREEDKNDKALVPAPKKTHLSRSSLPAHIRVIDLGVTDLQILIMRQEENLVDGFNLSDHPHVWLGRESTLARESGVLRRLFEMKKNGDPQLRDGRDECVYDPTRTKNFKAHYPKNTKIIFWNGFVSRSDALIAHYFIDQDEIDMWPIWIIWLKWMVGKPAWFNDMYQKLCGMEFALKMELSQDFVDAINQVKFPDK